MKSNKGLYPPTAFFGNVDKMPSATSLHPGVCRTTQELMSLRPLLLQLGDPSCTLGSPPDPALWRQGYGARQEPLPSSREGTGLL